MKNRILPLLMACVLLLSTLCLTVVAGERPDLERDCSVQITLRTGGEAVTDIRLSCIRVGYIYEKDDIFCYRRITDHALIPDIFETTLPGEMLRLAERHSLTGPTANPDAQGVVRFTALEQGVYLIRQVDAEEDGYSVLPFLVTLPFYRNGSYIYDLDSSAKVELNKEPTEPSGSTEPTQPMDPTKPSDGEDSPQTGQLNWPIPVMAMMGLFCLCLGFFLIRKPKKEG